MKRQLAMRVVAAVIAPVLGGMSPRAVGEDQPPVQVAAAGATAVPVRRVVLYTSGVGYFEHFGTVRGNADTVLSFKTDQINDVLKSLLLEDLDAGRISSVSYPTLAPLAQTLKSFQVDLSNDPPLTDILKQLRGAALTVTTPTGPVSGQVLGVEKKSLPVGDKVVDECVVNLLNDSGIVPVDLDKVTGVKLNDPELAGEMQKALSAVAQARDKDKKPVTISFAGNGDQRVRIGYVVETPIWKASYRISLGEAGAAPDPKAANVPVDQQGKIQGWAIVDNQTDNDWTDVELSLISGRPISFIEDLYQPLFVPRPTVQPDLFAGLVPQTYDEGMVGNGGLIEREIEQKQFSATNGSLGMAEGRSFYRNSLRAVNHRFDGQNILASGDELKYPEGWPGGVESQASGTQVGEAFQYTVGFAHRKPLAQRNAGLHNGRRGVTGHTSPNSVWLTVLPSGPVAEGVPFECS